MNVTRTKVIRNVVRKWKVKRFVTLFAQYMWEIQGEERFFVVPSGPSAKHDTATLLIVFLFIAAILTSILLLVVR